MKHDLENSPRVFQGVIVGAVIVGIIDGFNGLLEKADAEALHIQQHIGLVLKALALNVAEGPEIPGRDGTQARLRVGQPDAEQDFEKARGGFVARHRARRNTRRATAETLPRV